MLFGDFFKGVIFVGENHPAMEELAHEFHGAAAMACTPDQRCRSGWPWPAWSPPTTAT
jgi:hypothetical protein